MRTDEAEKLVLENFEGLGVSELRHNSIRAGIFTNPWQRNCIAIGYSAGCYEALAATYLHQIYTGILRLVQLFPHASSNELARLEYNRLSMIENENLRDYALLPYALNTTAIQNFGNNAKAVSCQSRWDTG